MVIKVKVKNNEVQVSIDLRLYCKIADINAEWQDSFNSRNVPLPQSVIDISKNGKEYELDIADHKKLKEAFDRMEKMTF